MVAVVAKREGRHPVEDLRRARVLKRLILESPRGENDRFYDELATLAHDEGTVPELGPELPAVGLEQSVMGELVSTLKADGLVEQFLSSMEADRTVWAESVQAVYGQLPRIVRTYGGQGSFKSYLRSSARNIRADVRDRHVKNFELEQSLLDSASLEEFEERSPSSNLVRRQDVARALSALAPNLRVCLQMCYMEDRPDREVEQALEITNGALRHLKRKAAAEFRSLIAKPYHG